MKRSGGGRNAVIGILLVVVGVTNAGCGLANSAANGALAAGNSSQTPGVTTWSGHSGPQLPTLAGTTLTGSKYDAAQARGRVLVINTWASWCYPCQSESPALARVARQVAGKGVSFVGIDEQDTASVALRFAHKVGAPYPSISDRSGSLLASLRIVPAAAIPSTIVVRADGHVAARIIGPLTAKALLAILRPLEH